MSEVYQQSKDTDYTKSLAQYIAGFSYADMPPEKITVIPNSADIALFRVTSIAGGKFLEAHPQFKGRKLVVYAGTLGFANGVDYEEGHAAMHIAGDENTG